MSWDQIEEWVSKFDGIRVNPLRMEVFRALKENPAVLVDKSNGGNERMSFFRIGNERGTLLGVEIDKKTALNFWCEEKFRSALEALEFLPTAKPYLKQPGAPNTGRHSALDQLDRFSPEVLLVTKIKSASEARQYVEAISSNRFDWTEFWGGLLGAMGEVDAAPSRTGTLVLSRKGGVRLELRTNTGSNMLQVTLSISGERASGRYNHLRSILPQIEGRFGSELSWQGFDLRTERYDIEWREPVSSINNVANWSDAYRKFSRSVELFSRTVDDLGALEQL